MTHLMRALLKSSIHLLAWVLVWPLMGPTQTMLMVTMIAITGEIIAGRVEISGWRKANQRYPALQSADMVRLHLHWRNPDRRFKVHCILLILLVNLNLRQSQTYNRNDLDHVERAMHIFILKNCQSLNLYAARKHSSML